MEVDFDSGNRGILARDLEQLRRKVEPGDLRAAKGARNRDNARSARDIEHALPGVDACKVRQLGRTRRGHCRERREVRPPFALLLLELGKGIRGELCLCWGI